MRVELVDIDKLLPYARNSRMHTEDQVAELAARIRDVGWTNPIIVKDNTILAGHLRLRAARKLGMTQVPVIRRDDMTEAEFRASVIFDNRIAEKSTWDNEMLTVEWDELTTDPDFRLEDTGFTIKDERQIRKEVKKARTEKAGDENEDIVIEIPANPITRSGDVWHCGDLKHIVTCGDSLQGNALKAVLGSDQVHAIACDPPYAIYGSSTGIASNIADDKMVRPFFQRVLELGKSYMPWFAHCYVCCDWRSWPAIWDACKHVATMEPKNLIVWDKGDYGMGNNYFNCYEMVGFFAKLPPEKTMTGSRKTGQRPIFKPNIQRYSRPMGKDREHNAAKPVALFRELIENSTGPGDTVLDPFCGSGTTMIAAHQLDRRCVSCDIEPAWVDVAVWRFIKLMQQPVTHAETGQTYEEVAHERGLGEVIVAKIAKEKETKKKPRRKKAAKKKTSGKDSVTTH